MESLGEFLKEVRMSTGITINQIAKDTRIAKKYLEAIEAEEFSEFPGEAYLKGFLRTYAVYLKLDPEEIINKYERIKIAETPTPIEQLIPKPKRNFKPLLIGITVVLGLALLGSGVFYLQKYIRNRMEIAKKDKANKEKINTYELLQTDKDKTFELKLNEKVQIKIDDKLYFIQIKKLDPTVLIVDKDNKETYLWGNILTELDINDDEIKDISLFLTEWDDKKAVITMNYFIDNNIAEGIEIIKDEEPNIVGESDKKDPIEVSLQIKNTSFIRYKIDDEDEIESLYRAGNVREIKAEKKILIWFSNSGVANLTFNKFDKTITPGKIGEVSVKLLKWKKASSGKYELQIISVK